MPRRKGGLKAALDFSAVKDLLVPYRRVSTREQADKGAGLAAQRTTLEYGLAMRGQQAYCWDCIDRGKSGKDMNRSELERALGIIRAGDAGGIIVSKLDRLSRSLLDFAWLMATASKEGWNIVALDLGVDLATPAGKAMAGVLAEMRDQGVRLGRPRAIDDELLGAIVAAYLGQQNFSAVSRWLNDAGLETPHGGRMWYPATVQKIVQSQDGRKLMEELAA